MKKFVYSILLFSITLVSCAQVDICTCSELRLQVLKDFKEANGDEAKINKIKADLDNNKTAQDCLKLTEENIKKTEEEQRLIIKDLEENCDAYKKILEIEK